MSPGQGQEAVGRLLGTGALERVTASDTLAGRLMGEAAAHLASARAIADADPTGAYQLAYDAARKACSALLAAEGLRATSQGGHVAVQEAVREQFGGPFQRFGLMRRRRHAGEYPGAGTPTISRADAVEGVRDAQEMLDAARTLLRSGQLTEF
jgi:hypothetical protein